WTEVWSITQYEQEPTVAAVSAGSALPSFDGHLYWSTMHLPLSGLLAFLQAPANQGRDLEPEELLAAAVGTNRATTVWRGDGFEALDDAGGTTIQAAPTGPYCTAPDEADSDGAVCELLYGEHAVLAHRPTGPRVAGHVPSPDWGLVPTGWTPRYGRSGLGLWLEIGGTVPEPEPLGNPFNAYTWAMEVFQGQL